MSAAWTSIFDAVPARVGLILADLTVPFAVAVGFIVAGLTVTLIARFLRGGD